MKEEQEDKIMRKKRIEHWQVVSLYLVLFDVIAVNVSYFAGLLLRFDLHFSQIPQMYLTPFLKFAPIYTVAILVVFEVLHLYNSLWRFASFSELNRLAVGTIITTVFQIVGITVLFQRMPISYYMIGPILQFILTVGIRFSYRYINMERARRELMAKKTKNAMIIGAGAAGQAIVKELKNSDETGAKPCCIIDDNPNKWGRFLDGVPIEGGRDEIKAMVEKHHIDQILFAIPSCTIQERREILNICNETGCELKRLPGMYQLANGEVAISKMKDVKVEDLLGRAPIRVNMDEIFNYIQGKVIMVTGGGGSIGSELCRQIAAHQPKQLIIFDVYENNAYSIQLELKKKYPDMDLVTLIGSVRDSRKIFKVFETYKPEIVYHAAAHKHVPLMEDSPCEAVKNNAIGTYKAAYAALAYGCKKFVLISTDKAVNPTNIMGASKRLCEMVIQAFDAKIKAGEAEQIPQLFTHWMDSKVQSMEVMENLKNAKTEFVAVRFGNVLGSNGSVIPLFKKQIEAGGPVTVTHPEIIRYFMTIPEAVSLVMQAGTYAKGREIFVLDMGEPVKIDTLARNLIRLSGHTPDGDIKIEYTGLRPGEKLFEEKLMAEEGLKKTANKLIHIGMPIPFDIDIFLSKLDNLMEKAYKNKKNIRELVADMVSTYHPEGDKNAKKTDETAEAKTAGKIEKKNDGRIRA